MYQLLKLHIKYNRIVFALILAILTTLALGTNYKVASWDIAAQLIGSQNSILVSIVKLRQNFDLYAFPWQIYGVVFCIIYYKKITCFQSISVLEITCAILFGSLNVISNSLIVNGNWGFVFANTYQFVISIICIAGQSVLFLLISKTIFYSLDQFRYRESIQLRYKIQREFKLFQKYPWSISFLILMFFWIPDLAIAYPAQITYDGVYQIMQWIGRIPVTNAHPFVSTWIIGALYRLGKLFGNDNFTIFFIAFCSSVIMAACYAEVIRKIKEMGVPSYIYSLVLLFYSLHPMIGEYAHTIIKDSISIPIFTLFILEVASFCISVKDYPLKKKNLIRLVLWSVLACELRHNYKYAIFPTLIVMLVVVIWKNRKAAKAIAICLMGCTLIVQGMNLFSEHVLHYPPGSTREALSLPFQQTARYVRDHAEEVTADERAAIASVLDYDSLAQKYNPIISDPVKGTYHGDTETLRQYFKAWWNMLLKHPETYIQSAIHGSYNYYAFTSQPGTRTIHDILRRDSYYRDFVDQLEMELAHPKGLEPILIVWENIKEFIIRIPILGLFSNCAAYTWLIIIIGIYFIRKNGWKMWLLLFPVMIILLTCIASPVNGNWRYYAPIVVSMPIIIVVCIKLLIIEDHFEEVGNKIKQLSD